MRSVKYIGETTNIGRFGQVKKGSVILVTEEEYGCVLGNPDYKLIESDVNAEAMELANGILPMGTPLFDLRTIPWENPKVSMRLAARASRNQLKSIVDSMRLAGAVVPEPDYDGDKIFVVDAIVTASRNMLWDKFTEEQRLQMPHIVDKGDGEMEVIYFNPENKLPPRVFADAPEPRFTKEGEEITTTVNTDGSVEVEQVAEVSTKVRSRTLKTVEPVRRRRKPLQVLTPVNIYNE